ncbi:neurotrimin-like isoform X1 [Phymastichus coffea]|uniref:neurotrimin-like isoform X1 n=1 Tax=Phymastichus coffea TaxID=108790 RepID=UPI00273AB948|nr:neurotrimin-like isoform X1 [Phymastichus coffea]
MTIEPLLARWLLPLLTAGYVAATATGTTTTTAATVKAYENDTVLLPCHVEDLGLQTRVRWYRSNVMIADSDDPSVQAATSPRVKMWDNRSLELLQVRPEDSGEYICQATRPEPWGHVTQVHEIQVMYPASAKPIPETGQIEVALGEEAVMTCLSEGVPKPVLAWSFQGVELPVLASGQKLRIHATNRSLAGLYTCEASNGVGEPAKANIELKIKHKPEVSALSRWVHSAPGVRAQLDCLVLAFPEAKIEWLYEGEKLARSQRALRYKQDRGEAQLHSLVIRTVQEHDLGQYTCRATNEIASAEANIELTALAKMPVLKKESRSSSSNSYNFIWEVDSNSPIVEYQFWFRQLDSREEWHRLIIPSSEEAAGPLHAHSFNLTGLQPSMRYEALVLARNKFGLSSPSKIVRFSTGQDAPPEEEAYKTDYKSGYVVEGKLEDSGDQVTQDSHRSNANLNGRPVDGHVLLSVLLCFTICKLIHTPS